VRIGDRNLLPTIRPEDFLAQLSSYRIKQLIDTDGKKIWSGTLNTRPELNVDVTTAFPVIEAVGKLDPGVYVVVAKPADDFRFGCSLARLRTHVQFISFPSEGASSQRKHGKMPCSRGPRWMLP
jgi:uncharacterized protein YfaS (alpha-2-macroglobulin family)